LSRRVGVGSIVGVVARELGLKPSDLCRDHVRGDPNSQLAPLQAETGSPQVINLADHQVRRRPILGGLTSEYQLAA
jgi:hypothetical protein